jgi:tetratricopeptide (TPR) repeat protein
MVNIPITLRNSLENGTCVLFLGAGMGHYYFDKDGNKIPDGRRLAEEMAVHFNINADDYKLDKISQIVEFRNNRDILHNYVKSKLSSIVPSEDVDWIPTIRWKAIYTTNYDNAIQIAYDRCANPKQAYKTISMNTDYQDQYFNDYDVPINHIHGALFNGMDNRITITQDDYTIYRERRTGMFEMLKYHMATSVFLYIGYSHEDSNWNMLLQELKAQFDSNKIPTGFKIDPYISDIDIELMKTKNITVLKATFDEFVRAAKIELREVKNSTEIAIKENIPNELKELHQIAPVSIVRLLHSWIFVNSQLTGEMANVSDFFRGDKPNWTLISSNIQFERDIEEEIYDELLDYATSYSKHPKVVGIFAPAGYGTTTVMMSLAVKLIKDRAGLVFFLMDGKEIKEGEIEFIVNNSTEKLYFFIDNVASNNTCRELEKVVQKLRDIKKSAMFVIGSRLNEFTQKKINVNISTHEIEPMSEGEVLRLINCLSNSKELGKLQDLSEEERCNAIRVNYKRELLVAIREATEGKSFEAIIADEYYNINNPVAQKYYLTICCFYQYGLFVRQSLMYDLLGVPLNNVHKEIELPLLGVVKTEDIDISKGYYAVRARHSLIARIVWELCATSSEKEDLILKIIDQLNITIKMDDEAFEKFTRNDQFIDSIGSYEKKVDFFEKARKKDPENQYVKQHYARMLIRTGKYQLALDQINNAINEAERLGYVAKVLFHTRGQAFGALALVEGTLSMARKYMFNAVAEYERAKAKDIKDVYTYQSIANLYFEWSKRKDIENQEATNYIEKAEEEISNGLKNVRAKETLWIISSEIQKYFEEDDRRITDLKKALDENPNKVITRYLLARAYSENKNYEEAIEILKPVIEHHPEEFRVIIEYAKIILLQSGDYKKAIAIMHTSRIYGFSDARFISTYGGMLSLVGDEKLATEIFKDGQKQVTDIQEIHKTHFRGICFDGSGELLRLKGKVIEVNVGYSLIIGETPYPVYLIPSSKINKIVLTEGLEVYFEPVFCVKGPRADNISLEG